MQDFLTRIMNQNTIELTCLLSIIPIQFSRRNHVAGKSEWYPTWWTWQREALPQEKGNNKENSVAHLSYWNDKIKYIKNINEKEISYSMTS